MWGDCCDFKKCYRESNIPTGMPSSISRKRTVIRLEPCMPMSKIKVSLDPVCSRGCNISSDKEIFI